LPRLSLKNWLTWRPNGEPKTEILLKVQMTPLGGKKLPLSQTP